MDNIVYAMLKKRIAAVASGIKSVKLGDDGKTLIFTPNEGPDISVTLPDANGIKDMEINSEGHLIVTLDNDEEIDAGEAPAGLSAYEIAVKNGFIGTEQEWLDSLKSSINMKKVDALPTSGMNAGTIYLIPSADAGTTDAYDEFLFIDGAWERLGTRQSTKEQIDNTSIVFDTTNKSIGVDDDYLNENLMNKVENSDIDSLFPA